MTTMTLTAAPGFRPGFHVVGRPASKPRAPRPELTGRDPFADSLAAVSLRFGLAAVPFAGLAWLFFAF